MSEGKDPLASEREAVAITFTIEAKINQGRSIVAQTAIARDADAKTINEIMDKVAAALDRQEAKALIKGLKITLERDNKTLENTVNQVANLKTAYENEWASTGRKGPFELRGQQKSNVENQEKSLQALKERIDTINRDIKELEQVAA
jgi:hypothetical protein